MGYLVKVIFCNDMTLMRFVSSKWTVVFLSATKNIFSVTMFETIYLFLADKGHEGHVFFGSK